jgi:hypothetical protein
MYTTLTRRVDRRAEGVGIIGGARHERGRPVLWTSLSLPAGQRDSLEEPPRPYIASYVVYAGDSYLVTDLGVDGSPVAHGYADVGDVSAPAWGAPWTGVP